MYTQRVASLKRENTVFSFKILVFGFMLQAHKYFNKLSGMPYCLHLNWLSTLIGLIWRQRWHLCSNGKGVTSQKTGMIAVVAVRISKVRILRASSSYTCYFWRAAMSARIKMSFRHVYRVDVRPRRIGLRGARTQALILSSRPELLGVPQNFPFVSFQN
jgi:hypothetical protein